MASVDKNSGGSRYFLMKLELCSTLPVPLQGNGFRVTVSGNSLGCWQSHSFHSSMGTWTVLESFIAGFQNFNSEAIRVK